MLFLEEIRIIKRGEIQWSVFSLLSKFQHHKITEWLRYENDLWRLCDPTPLLKQGHQELITQDYVQHHF